MKKLLFVSILLLASFLVMAQDEEETQKEPDRAYISIGVGAAIPVGNFNSKSVKNESAGYAKVGPTGAIGLGYRFKGNFGLAARITGTMHNLDESYYEGDTTKLTISPLYNYSIVAGPMLVHNVAPDIMVSFKALVGAGMTLRPEIKNPDQILSISKESELYAVGSLGASCQYVFSADKKWSFLTEVDYSWFKPEFKETNVENLYEFPIGKITVFNVNVGVSYHF